jgi:hypothetical protein
MMMPTLAVATAHAFVLTVSHGLLFRQPPFTATALLPPLLSNSPDSIVRRRAARYRPLDFRSRFQSQRPVLGKSHCHVMGNQPAGFNTVRSARQLCAR